MLDITEKEQRILGVATCLAKLIPNMSQEGAVLLQDGKLFACTSKSVTKSQMNGLLIVSIRYTYISTCRTIFSSQQAVLKPLLTKYLSIYKIITSGKLHTDVYIYNINIVISELQIS